MRTKKILTTLLSIILLLSLVLTMFACKKDEKEGEDTEAETDDVVEDQTVVNLPFGKENYNKEIKFLYYVNTMTKNYHFDDITESGDVIKAALVDRRLMVEDYLGVFVVGQADGTGESSVYQAISRDFLNGNDTYQVAMTHNYIGVDTLVMEGLIRDLYEFEHITFNEDYWHMDAVEALEVGGKAYYGSSDFLISDVCGVFYNKEMYEQYQIKENPYDLVRDGKWTMEKFMELASNVAINDGDPAWDKEDTYGLGVRADWEFLPLIDSCEVEWLTGSAHKTLNMGANNERYLKLYELVEEMADADWSYMYNWGDDENKVTIADGRFLFTMEPLKYAPNYLDSEVKFGVLPYPKFDETQKDYHTCDFGGALCVPLAAKDQEIIGKTLEAISYFSADTICVAYYERLLGYRVAEAADDSEMLDKYIFGKITLNPAITYSGKANKPLGILVYTIPKMLRAKLNDTPVVTIANNWASNKVAAQEVIDQTLNK